MPKLYSNAVILGYRRTKSVQQESTSILRIEGVKTRKDTDFYLGKRVAYIYKVKKSPKDTTGKRVIWGKVTRPHGKTGAVRAQFKSNLPPTAIAQLARVMLYPSRV